MRCGLAWICFIAVLATGCTTPEDSPVIEGPRVLSLSMVPMPDYPPMARMARVSGEIELRGTLDSRGQVLTCEVISGPPMLRSTAITWVKLWAFQNPKPHDDAFIVRVRFRFADDESTKPLSRFPWCVTGKPPEPDIDPVIQGGIRSGS